MDLHDINEDSVLDSEHDAINYMNVDISTDNIEDIVTSKMGDKVNAEDIYMIHNSDETDQSDMELPKALLLTTL